VTVHECHLCGDPQRGGGADIDFTSETRLAASVEDKLVLTVSLCLDGHASRVSECDIDKGQLPYLSRRHWRDALTIPRAVEVG
jgi:hypothetical protein